VKNANWRDIVEFVGILAIVGSLIFVGLQMQQDRQLAVAQLFAETDDSVNNIAALTNEYQDVWLRGSRGDQLSPEDEASFQNLFMSARYAYASFFETQLRLNVLSTDWIAKKYAFQLYSNPGLRRIWDRRIEYDQDQSVAYGSAYSPTLFEAEVSRFLDNLDSTAAEPSKRGMHTIW